MYHSSPKRSQTLLPAHDTVLVIIDVQERFRTVVNEIERVIKNSSLLCGAARLLDIPILITEQYPEKLGGTVSEIMEKCEGKAEQFSKLSFSAMGNKEFFLRLKKLNKKHIVIAGLETHVCVQQTVLDLLANFDGWMTVVVDAISSRKVLDREVALKKMEKQGVSLGTVESVLFEWLETAGTPEFKQVQKLIL